jgi:hypothetical protein
MHKTIGVMYTQTHEGWWVSVVKIAAGKMLNTYSYRYTLNATPIGTYDKATLFYDRYAALVLVTRY